MRAFVAVSSLLVACRAEASLPLAAGYGYAAGVAPFATHGAYANAALTYGAAAPLAATYTAAPLAHATYHAPAAAVAVAPAVSTAVAAPVAAVKTVAAPAPAVPSVTSTQYRAGDELGNDAFGYSNINSARQESRTPAGVSGSYSYVDEAGVHTRTYVADAYGFRVTGDNLPAAPLVAHRRRRSVLAAPVAATTYATALNAVAPLAAHAVLPAATAPLAATYAHAPLAATYAHAPLAATYAHAPLAATYAHAPVAATYAAAPVAAVAAAPAVAATYAAPAAAAREAVLTTIKLNPGHATAYRVD